MPRTIGRRAAGLTALAAAGTVAATAAAQAAPAKERITYHLNQPGGEGFRYYRQLLRNLRNHLSVLPPEGYDLRVVMHGAGLGLLREAARQDPQIAAAVDELKLAGVRFEICRITLRLDNIRLEELYDAAEDDLVESGVAQLARLQHQGFAYIKV
jgi:intracellular sulfur oxidation DsrE/DsrF family protein